MWTRWIGMRRAIALAAAMAGVTLSACAAESPDALEPSDSEWADADAVLESTFELGAPYAIGAGASAAAWTPFVASGTTIYATSVTPTRAVTLRALQLVTAAAGGSCRLGLYDEANARPARLIASGSVARLVAGTNSAPTATAPQLAAGRRYWVAALCSGSPQLYRANVTGETSYSGFGFSFLALPSTFPSGASASNSRALRLFALVEDLGVCTPQTRQCLSPSTLGICAADGSAWIAQQCASTCLNGTCLAAVCAPGSRRCSVAGNAEVCAADGSSWQTQLCAGACANGVCSACTPGTIAPMCASATSRLVCASDGSSYVAQACPASSSVCSNGACVSCTTNICRSPGELAVCSNGVVLIQACSANATCVNAACTGECRAGATRCSANTAQLCAADGTWVVANICTSSQACRDGHCE